MSRDEIRFREIWHFFSTFRAFSFVLAVFFLLRFVVVRKICIFFFHFFEISNKHIWKRRDLLPLLETALAERRQRHSQRNGIWWVKWGLVRARQVSELIFNRNTRPHWPHHGRDRWTKFNYPLNASESNLNVDAKKFSASKNRLKNRKKTPPNKAARAHKNIMNGKLNNGQSHLQHFYFQN